MMQDAWRMQMRALGEFIRTQRKLADLSIRELAEATSVSNAYLSQIERGLHEPSVRVLRSIAKALNISGGALLVQAGLIEGEEVDRTNAAESAIRADPDLSDNQKEALLAVYRGFKSGRV